MSELQTAHFIVSASALTIALMGCLAMLFGLVLPVRSAVGNKLFASGVVMAICSVVVYLLYSLASVVTVVVMRS